MAAVVCRHCFGEVCSATWAVEEGAAAGAAAVSVAEVSVAAVLAEVLVEASAEVVTLAVGAQAAAGNSVRRLNHG